MLAESWDLDGPPRPWLGDILNFFRVFLKLLLLLLLVVYSGDNFQVWFIFKVVYYTENNVTSLYLDVTQLRLNNHYVTW